MLGFLAEMQRVDRLLIVREGLRDRANDSRLRVASERGLQYARHLAVPVVDEGLAVALGELIDDVGEGE